MIKHSILYSKAVVFNRGSAEPKGSPTKAQGFRGIIGKYRCKYTRDRKYNV